MKLTEDQKTKMCDTFFRRYPHVKINDKYKVIEIEHCDYSCADFIRDYLYNFMYSKSLSIFYSQ